MPIIEALPQHHCMPIVAIEWSCPQEWLDRLDKLGVSYVPLDSTLLPSSQLLKDSQISPETIARSASTPKKMKLFPAMRQWGINKIPKQLKQHVIRGIESTIKNLPLQAKYFYQTLLAYRQLSETHSHIFKQIQPDVIITVSDVGIHRSAPIKVACQLGIPSLLVPLYYLIPEREARWMQTQPGFVEHFSLTPLWNRLAARLIPGSVAHADDVPVLHYPGGEALALKLLGIAPLNPWFPGSGLSTKVAVESKREYSRLLSAGIPKQKIALTGKARTDILYQRMQIDRQERAVYLGINPIKSVILLAPPHLAEHRLLDWPEHWKAIDDLIASLTSLDNVVIILTLYPGSCKEDYQAIADKHGALIPEPNDFFTLMPLCDIYVANTTSSTIVQAIACHKPAIAIDLDVSWNLSECCYDPLEGVIVVRDKHKLRPTLEHLLTDRAAYGKLVRFQREAAPDWAVVDGKCTERIVEQIKSLADMKIS